MRNLALTSPETRGEDVRQLQHVLNERLEHYKLRQRLKVDGVYGRETAHAVSHVAFLEGLETYSGTPGVQRLIEHPHERLPAQLFRAKHREEARAHHADVPGVGLERLPAIAAHYIGVAEKPPGSNWGEPEPAGWEKEWGFDSGVSWCACFACSIANLGGCHITGSVPFCPNIEAYARAGTHGFEEWRSNHTEGVGPGWLVLYNWVGGSEPEHVGIVEKLEGGHLVAIEGNTSGTNPSDGGMVARMVRPYSFTVGYAKPRI